MCGTHAKHRFERQDESLKIHLNISMLTLKSKVAVVTGASSGIGREVSLSLAQSGATVYAVARRFERLTELQKQYPHHIIPVAQDVTAPLTALNQALGDSRIDILVNNAGGALGRESIEDCPEENWHGMIAKNLTSLIAITQLVLPKMLEQKSGDILNVGSIAGLQTYPQGSVYCAVKSAVVALTEAWQQDLLGKGIRVMGIHPGLAETEFSITRFKGDEEKAKKVYEGMTPLTAKDIAESIMWMLVRPRHVNIPSLTILPTHQATASLVWRGK